MWVGEAEVVVRQGATVRELKRMLSLQLARVVDAAWGDRSAGLSWSVVATEWGSTAHTP